VNTEMDRFERLAERLQGMPPVTPDPATRIRAWNLVSARLAGGPVAAPARRFRPFRLATALAAALAVLLVGSAVASAQSLPNSPLYSIKRFDEGLRLALTVGAPTRFSYHLELARIRLVEAQAMVDADRLDLAEAALQSYEADLAEAAAEAEQAGSPADQALLENRLQEAIQVHDAQLANLQGQVTNPAAVAAIQAARDRALNTTPPAAGKPKTPAHSPKSSP
jgi:nucleotide-binding universal stress UspA family protein